MILGIEAAACIGGNTVGKIVPDHTLFLTKVKPRVLPKSSDFHLLEQVFSPRS